MKRGGGQDKLLNQQRGGRVRRSSVSPTAHLQDPGLLLELLVLVRVGVGQLVDPDPLLRDLVQDLRGGNRRDSRG